MPPGCSERWRSSGLAVSPSQANRIDLLTSITGVGFDEAWATRSTAVLDGLAVAFIGRNALIRNKEATGRVRDLADAEQLRDAKS
jgi:hypothetical protein